MVQLKDDLKQLKTCSIFLAELCIYHTAFKGRVVSSEWKSGRERTGFLDCPWILSLL